MTLEQVKEHFKNAKEVKCAYDGAIEMLKDDFKICDSYHDKSFSSEDTVSEKDVFLYDGSLGKLAEITKYKTNDVTVSEQLVKGYHKDACSDFKKRIEKDFPQFFPEETYKLGDRFSNGADEYILARVDNNKINFINLEDGNQWIDPINVKNDCNISQKEFKALCDGFKFNKIS